MGRRDGVLYAEVRCRDGRVVELPVLFSFKGVEEEEGRIRCGAFSPPGILKFLERAPFFFLKDSFGRCLIKARAVEVGEEEAVVELLGERFREKRLFDRFSFCPEEFGEFEVRKGGERIGKGFIVDASLTGIRVEFEGRVRVERGELLTLTRGTRVIEVEVVRSSEEGGKRVIGGKLLCTNFCVISLVIESYTRVVKELLTKTP